MTKRIGVLLSGRGSNLEALADSAAAGRIPNAEIAIVISNREGAPGIERAKARGIETRVIPSKGLEREAYDKLVAAALREMRVDLVCLAGFMRLLSPYFISSSVHFVDETLDAGPIIVQSVVPVRDDDTQETLSARILVEEHKIYTQAVCIVLEGRYHIAGRRVLLSP